MFLVVVFFLLHVKVVIKNLRCVKQCDGWGVIVLYKCDLFCFGFYQSFKNENGGMESKTAEERRGQGGLEPPGNVTPKLVLSIF